LSENYKNVKEARTKLESLEAELAQLTAPGSEKDVSNFELEQKI
jgi:hypothetical protein